MNSLGTIPSVEPLPTLDPSSKQTNKRGHQDAYDYLRPDNQRLAELKEKYSAIHLPVMDHSVWTDDHVSREVDLALFRRDNAYLWQHRDGNEEINYLITAYYLRTIDSLDLLNTLREDEMFGAEVFSFHDGSVISRDLLDSIAEIYFLEQTIGISHSSFTALDIGAGYGRLAHRMVSALPSLRRVFCIDSVATSTFLCEYYLRFRGVDDRARSIPFCELGKLIDTTHIDLAINVSSFSECKLSAISWWIATLRKHGVRYLMIVPNPPGNELLSREKGWEREQEEGRPIGINYLPELEHQGYKLICKRPKYLDSGVQKYGVSPSYHYLFELL